MSCPKPNAEEFLNRQIICTLTDGRKVEGNLQCIDWLKNIILRDVVETRFKEDGDILLHRELSQCMVAGETLVKIEVTRNIYDSVAASE